MTAKKVVFAIIFILTITPVFCYDFTDDFENGIYWGSFPISVAKYVSTASEGSQLNSLVTQAEAQWEDAVGQEIWDIASGYNISTSYSGNNIRWSDDFAADTGYSASSTLAVTIRYRTGTYFTYFEIILNGENENLRNNTNNMLYQTILHELGHTIGLDHSEYTSAVMYASLQGINSLSYDDEDGFVAVVDETLDRQETGYVSELATSTTTTSSGALACGSVAFIGDDDDTNSSGGGPATVLMGAMLALMAGMISRKRQLLPVRA